MESFRSSSQNVANAVTLHYSSRLKRRASAHDVAVSNAEPGGCCATDIAAIIDHHVKQII